ncbi:hypothetical protein pb186bvf_002070 [Paramecium bursaria]
MIVYQKYAHFYHCVIKKILDTININYNNDEAILAYADSYVLSQKCSCEQLLNLNDCVAQSCQWVGRCQSISSDSNLQTISDRCSSIDRPDIYCPITLGCAFWQNKCTIFPGCEYFPLNNNKDCQKISAQCTSDGITCIYPLSCSQYSPDRCTESISSSGTGFCKLDVYGQCVDQTCENGEYDSDFECDNYLEGCVTNGQWCVSQRKPCSSYTKDCEKFIGRDGRCSSKCQSRTCAEYQIIATTDSICSNYQYGCISSGYGCVQAPLPSCTSYNYTDLICYQLIGSEGRCDVQNNKCVPRICQYASYNNNQQCDQYKSGCITNGIQCVDSLNLCSQYLGTTATCQLITGSDGKCIGTSDTISYCKLLDCSTADQTFNSDEKCKQYQQGCVTNGKGCIQSNLRAQCEANSKSLQCNIHGSNGKCYDDPTNLNACSRIPCSLGLFTDNDKCSLYQDGCVSNGTQCVDVTSCVATRSQIACKGTNGCTNAQVCVQNVACSQFQYQNTCFKAGGKDCIWSNNACRDLKCSDYVGTQQQCAQKTVNGIQCYNLLNALPTQECTNIQCTFDITSTTDSACNAFLKGCVTTGKGCIEVTGSCRNFNGTAEQCLLYRNQTCIGSGVCSDRKCSDNTILQSDSDCNTFLAGCVTTFPGCIESTAPCEKYPGTSESFCLRFKSNGKFCNWTGGSFCTTRLCSQQLSAISNFDCNNFLAGCLTNGKGCYDPSVPCNQYLGSQQQCVAFTGNLKQCARRVQCKAKTCSDTIQAGSQQDCISYLATCRFNGQQCVNSQALCNLYSGILNNTCQTITTTSGGKCWGSSTCADRQCSDNVSASSQNDCNQFLSGCVFTGSKCMATQTQCSNYGNFSQAACNAAADSSGNKCTLLTAGTGTCKIRECSDVTTNCTTYLSSCVSSGTSCQIQQTSCNLYTSFTQAACNDVSDTHGNKCWMESAGSISCSARSCSDTVLGASTITCQQHKSSCQFNGTTCVDQQTDCALYLKFTAVACQAATIASGAKCTSIQNSIGTCTSLTCNDLIQNPSTTVCQNYLSTCTFNGSVCVVQQALCTKYVNFTPDACRSTQDSTGKYCWFTSQNFYSGPCQDRTCSDILPQFNQETCSQHLATCTYNGFSCFNIQDNCQNYINFTQQACRDSVTTGGIKCWLQSSLPGTCTIRSCSDQIPNPGYQACLDHNNCAFDGVKCLLFQTTCELYTNLSFQQCQIIKTQSGTLCWGIQNSANCIQRLCTHNTTAISDQQCQSFLPSCITVRPGCISQDSLCSVFTSTPDSCSQFRGCRGDDSNGNCDNKVCYDNLIATSDQECIQYSAQCLTNGMGCVNKSDSCSFYQGTEETCKKFIGNGIRCWQILNAPATTPCIEAQCSYNLTASNDNDCKTFMNGCLTKGTGCIASTEPCSSYYGTQAQCNKFIGNGQICWNTDYASITDPCVTRSCFQNIFSSSDAECNLFLKGCVSKGQGCTTPQPCSQFFGNIRSCRQYTATDGPCKGVDDSVQSCLILQCSDAPNTYNTDYQCNQFKSGCMTTGAGCDSNVQCSDLVSLNNCGQKPTCQIMGMCDIQHSKCSDYNTPSYCSSNQKCVWYQGFCQDWKCFNAPQNLNTHLACSKLGDDCTTNGNGCMRISKCSNYTFQNACLLAVSSDPAGSCIWTGTRCRSKQCEDAQKSNNTDKLCNLYIIGCLTSGRGCITKPTNCSQYLTQKILKAIHVFGEIIYAINLTDAMILISRLIAECNTFLNSCTTNGDTCIPKTFCTKYENVHSCVQGIDGPCGWTNDLKCVLFTSCQQSTSVSLTQCQSFNKQCVTDGAQCIAMTNCANYKSQTSCNTGSDGPCTWYLTYCRATICSDLKALTHLQCYNFKAQTQCTTDGVQCIPIPTCALQQQAACVIGTDGPLQVCTDLAETSTANCNSLISGCISDGQKCISKAKCSTYTTKLACNSGGTDGICAYVGNKCVLMSSCSIANSDQIACSQNQGCSYTRTSVNGIQANICTDANCRLASKIVNQCNPVSNFAQTNYSICIPSINGCILGDGQYLTANNCYKMSGNTYTWNPTTLKCQQCNPIKIINDTNTTNTTNNTNNTQAVLGYINILNLIMIMIL